MTNETYPALAACARRRIDDEWRMTAAEESLLMLVCEMSFDLGQSWACIPALADFAEVLGIHKSTVSRALRSARKKGFLQVLMRADETLYSLCLETRGQTPASENGRRDAARKRLVEMNKNRLQGRADADGQQRLPGVLDSEELDAPAAAFEAMMEAPQAETIPEEATIIPPTTRAHADDDDETDAEFHARLERLTMTMEAQRGDPPSPPPRSSTAPGSVNSDTFDDEMDKYCRGLRGEALHAMQRLREEFQSAGRLQEAAFFKWGRVWRRRAVEYTRAVLEACGEHKNKRLTGQGADEPGAWIYSALRGRISGMN